MAVRTNLLWDAAAEPNIGLEFPVGKHFSLGVNAGIKTWPRWLFWDNDYTQKTSQWRNFAVVPEVRYYFDRVYDGVFIGADVVYTHFNVGNVKFPFHMYPEVENNRLQGDFVGGGLFAGYSWWLGQYIRIEAEAGVAVGMAAYDKYDCAYCGSKLGEARKPAVVPKLGVNIAWNPVARDKRPGTGAAANRDAAPAVLSAPVPFEVAYKALNGTDSTVESFNHEVLDLLKAKRYQAVVEKLESDSKLMTCALSDAEAMNVYGVALYFTALDKKDTDQEVRALEFMRRAAHQGSVSAQKNLDGAAVYGPARKEFEAWKALMDKKQ